MRPGKVKMAGDRVNSLVGPGDEMSGPTGNPGHKAMRPMFSLAPPPAAHQRRSYLCLVDKRSLGFRPGIPAFVGIL